MRTHLVLTFAANVALWAVTAFNMMSKGGDGIGAPIAALVTFMLALNAAALARVVLHPNQF